MTELIEVYDEMLPRHAYSMPAASGAPSGLVGDAVLR